MTEAALRDAIAQNIEMLERGLTLLDKEKYIPSELGTRSFIDLYAKDSEGHHVLIELKRADAAAREALHEVHKYVEGVKAHFGAKDAEIRVIVASTEWKELLVPFSRFSADTKLEVLGLQLEIGTSNVISSSKVSMVPVTQGRFIAPWHEVHWHKDRASLDRGIASIEAWFKHLGVDDFVIVVLKPPKPVSSEHQAAMKETIRQIANMRGVEFRDKALPVYEYIAYFAMQMLSRIVALAIVERHTQNRAEVESDISSMEEEEALYHLYEQVSVIEPRPEQDHLEIGYPAKLKKYLDAYNFAVQEVRRYGRFKRNPLLDDEAILSELRGEDGSTGQSFKRTVSVSNRAHMAAARSEISNCLESNPAWKGHVLTALDEIEKKFPQSEVDVSIFNPETGILTLYFPTTRVDGPLFIPQYHLTVRNPGPTRMYYGALQAEGNALTFRKLLDKYYDGDLGALLFTFSWGGRESRDADIVNDLGAAYKSFRCDIHGKERKCFELKDGRWHSRECATFLDLFSAYLQKNERLLQEIQMKVGACDRDGYWESPNMKLILGQQADIERGRKEKTYYVDAPAECAICECQLNDEEYMIDGRIPTARGAWACMCPDCFSSKGEGIGVGRGQLYKRIEDGWLLVGGFPDSGDGEALSTETARTPSQSPGSTKRTSSSRSGSRPRRAGRKKAMPPRKRSKSRRRKAKKRR